MQKSARFRVVSFTFFSVWHEKSDILPSLLSCPSASPPSQRQRARTQKKTQKHASIAIPDTMAAIASPAMASALAAGERVIAPSQRSRRATATTTVTAMRMRMRVDEVKQKMMPPHLYGVHGNNFASATRRSVVALAAPPSRLAAAENDDEEKNGGGGSAGGDDGGGRWGALANEAPTDHVTAQLPDLYNHRGGLFQRVAPVSHVRSQTVDEDQYGVRIRVRRNRNRCWHANGKRNLVQPTLPCYELLRQLGVHPVKGTRGRDAAAGKRDFLVYSQYTFTLARMKHNCSRLKIGVIFSLGINPIVIIARI